MQREVIAAFYGGGKPEVGWLRKVIKATSGSQEGARHQITAVISLASRTTWHIVRHPYNIEMNFLFLQLPGQG